MISACQRGAFAGVTGSALRHGRACRGPSGRDPLPMVGGGEMTRGKPRRARRRPGTPAALRSANTTTSWPSVQRGAPASSNTRPSGDSPPAWYTSTRSDRSPFQTSSTRTVTTVTGTCAGPQASTRTPSTTPRTTRSERPMRSPSCRGRIVEAEAGAATTNVASAGTRRADNDRARTRRRWSDAALAAPAPAQPWPVELVGVPESPTARGRSAAPRSLPLRGGGTLPARRLSARAEAPGGWRPAGRPLRAPPTRRGARGRRVPRSRWARR